MPKTLRIILFATLIISLIFVYFTPITPCITRHRKTSTKSNPNILWNTFEPNDFSLRFIKKETLSCPRAGGETQECNMYVSWEDHPSNIDAYLSSARYFFEFPEYRDPDSLWGFFFEESSRVNPAVLNEKFLNLFNFSATYSRHSDVPFPLIYLANKARKVFEDEKSNYANEPSYFKGIRDKTYYMNTKMKNFYLNDIAPVLYLQSNPITFVDRDEYVLKLMEYIAVDSCGNRIHNKALPKNLTQGFENYVDTLIDTDQFLNYTARYKFQIAIESAVCSDYMTEKLWRPIVQGVVPIYFGSPTVRDWLPNEKSAILIEDFASPELLAEYLKELLSNDTKYEEHLDHKTKGIITNQKLLDEFNNQPNQVSILYNVRKFQCFICKKLHEDRLNNSKVNIVTRKALDCKMPYSILTHSPDHYNPFLTSINENVRTVDYVFDKYMKRETINPTKLKLVKCQHQTTV